MNERKAAISVNKKGEIKEIECRLEHMIQKYKGVHKTKVEDQFNCNTNDTLKACQGLKMLVARFAKKSFLPEINNDNVLIN